MKNSLYFGIIILTSFFILIACQSQYVRKAKLAIRDENDPHKAIKYLEMEINKNPENADAYLLLSKVYGQYEKDYTKSFQYAKKSVELDPEKKPAANAISTTCWAQLHNMGLDKFEAKDYESSLDYFKKASNIIPDSLVTKRMLARVYIQMDSLKKAKKVLTNIIEKHNEDEKAKKEVEAAEAAIEAIEVIENSDKKDTSTAHKYSYSLGPFSIEIIKIKGLANKMVEVQIKITNISDRNIHNATMTCVAENSAGRPIDFKKHYVVKSTEGGLNSGNSTYFTYILDANPGLVNNTTFQIENIKYKE